MRISREIKTGVIAILIIVLFVWGYNFMKDRSLTDKIRVFYAEYENVEGLAINSPVTINGMKVGKVSDISFSKIKRDIVDVHIELTNEVLFSKNSIAEIYSPDFISGKSLRIMPVYDNAESAVDGDTLNGLLSGGIMDIVDDKINPLITKIDKFVVSTDSVMVSLDKVLDKKNVKHISNSLANLDATLANFNRVSKDFNALMKQNKVKIDSILDNAHTSMRNITSLTSSLKEADLAATIVKLQTTLDGFNRILDSMEKGEGSIGKLLKDDSLYNNLTSASKELEELLKEIKIHPKRFVHLSVFGKKEAKYVPEPEDQQ